MIFLKIWLKYNHNTLRAHITYNGLLAASVRKSQRDSKDVFENLCLTLCPILPAEVIYSCALEVIVTWISDRCRAYQEIQEFTGYNACTVPEINWVLVGFRWFETPQCCDKFFIEINNKIKYIFFLNFFPKIAI